MAHNNHNNNQYNNHDNCCGGHTAQSGCACGHNHAEVDKGSFLFKLIGGGFFFVLGWLLSELTEKGTIAMPSSIYLLCFALSYLIVGFDIVKEAVEGVIHGDIFNENLLMCIASIGAFAVGEYSEGCAVVFLYTVGEFLQGLAVDKSRRSIKNMLGADVREVRVIKNGEEIGVDAQSVQPGDIMVIRAGERLELDSVIVSGKTQFDMRALTGEAVPLTKSEGDNVPAGSINLDEQITVKAEREYKDSTVCRILDMLDSSQDETSKTQKFITRFAKIYTPVVCLIAIAIMVIPPLFFGGEWHDWLYRGLSALVVSCPCALVISIPLGFFAGVGACSKNGILVKGENYLEALAKADTGIFDKSGTLTSGKFDFVTCEHRHCHCADNQHRELLKIIAACEKISDRPIAKSINMAFGHYADDCVIEQARELENLGVSAVVDGIKYYVGGDELMRLHCDDFEETSVIGTPVYCCKDGEFMGDIVFADVVKQDSLDALAQLKKLGIGKAVMMTDGKKRIADSIADEAGIDEVYFHLSPQEKAEVVKKMQENGETVIYAGDGISDAPVLKQADAGVAVGGAGSEIAVQAADIVIMGSSLSKLALAKKIAKKTVHVVRENIIFALAVKIMIILGCAVGIFDENAMWLAVFGDVGVCLIAIANSLRALIVKKIKFDNC